jgi:putative acetyltransferase
MSLHAVRLYEPRDAADIAYIFHAAIEGLAPKHYSPAQVAAWSARGADAEGVHKRCTDGRAVWVATDENAKTIAFTDCDQNGYIDMLFCHPDHAGRGVTSKLFRTLEAHARRANIQTLTVEASACAQPVFAHWGFETVTRNDFEVNGVAVFNFSMKKPLGTQEQR